MILCIGILIAGCIDYQQKETESHNQTDTEFVHLDSDSINPLNKNITKYEWTFSATPRDKNIIWYQKWGNDSRSGFTNETLITESDLIFYGTVQEVQPAVWSTYSGKAPFILYFKLPEKGMMVYESGSWEYKSITSSVTQDEYIYSDIVFEVDDWVKGPAEKEMTISVKGGRVGKFAMMGAYPNPWDFKAGEKYLIYSKDLGSGQNEIMYPGLFIVHE
ncbi:hypothetical protein [Methanolapillus ohkumae]|uniref:hypothetical protein n=1 Tax=Methanolapillus ohkumae TaxID=3028298 RepID=UPI0030B8F6F7